MAEEHRCQAPRLCANNCGFFGSPTTHNFCSKCYRDLQLEDQQSSSAKLAFNQTLTPPSSSSSSSSSSSQSQSQSQSQSPDVVSLPAVDSPDLGKNHVAVDEIKEEVEVKVVVAVGVQPNRCLTCKKRVGLTGFKCRCGMTFCGTHRYPEQHGCSFDFKAMGKEQIAKANPIVKAEKLEKI